MTVGTSVARLPPLGPLGDLRVGDLLHLHSIPQQDPRANMRSIRSTKRDEVVMSPTR
jgi:hypothetical protein